MRKEILSQSKTQAKNLYTSHRKNAKTAFFSIVGKEKE